MSTQSKKYRDAVAHLLGDKPVAFHPDIAESLGSIHAALLLGQLLWWTFNPTAEQREGWFWKTSDEIRKETALTVKEQVRARKVLLAAKVIEYELRDREYRAPDGSMQPLFYRVSWYRVDLDRIAEILANYYETGKPTVRRKVPNPNQHREDGRFAKRKKGNPFLPK